MDFGGDKHSKDSTCSLFNLLFILQIVTFLKHQCNVRVADMLKSTQSLFITLGVKSKFFGRPLMVLSSSGHSLLFFFLPFNVSTTLHFTQIFKYLISFLLPQLSLSLRSLHHVIEASSFCFEFYTHVHTHYTTCFPWLNSTHHPSLRHNFLWEDCLNTITLVSGSSFVLPQQLIFHLHNTYHNLLYFSIFAFLFPISLSAPLEQELFACFDYNVLGTQ